MHCSCLEKLLSASRFSQSIFITHDCNMTRTLNQLVCKRTFNHLAKLAKLTSLTKWLSVRLRTKWLWSRVPLQSL